MQAGGTSQGAAPVSAQASTYTPAVPMPAAQPQSSVTRPTSMARALSGSEAPQGGPSNAAGGDEGGTKLAAFNLMAKLAQGGMGRLGQSVLAATSRGLAGIRGAGGFVLGGAPQDLRAQAARHPRREAGGFVLGGAPQDLRAQAARYPRREAGGYNEGLREFTREQGTPAMSPAEIQQAFSSMPPVSTTMSPGPGDPGYQEGAGSQQPATRQPPPQQTTVPPPQPTPSPQPQQTAPPPQEGSGYQPPKPARPKPTPMPAVQKK